MQIYCHFQRGEEFLGTEEKMNVQLEIHYSLQLKI